MAIVIGIIAAHTYTGTTFSRIHGSRHITMDHVFNGTFYARTASLRWVPEGALFYLLRYVLLTLPQREMASTLRWCHPVA